MRLCVICGFYCGLICVDYNFKCIGDLDGI